MSGVQSVELGGAAEPELSLIVTIVCGGEVLRRFLRALISQEDPPRMQIIVPCDSTVRLETVQMQAEFPACTFVDMGVVSTIRAVTTAAGQHELYDRRRAAGLAIASADLIGILEDRAPPRSDWARNAIRLHRELPHGVIGGAIECADTDILNWSFYACDFSRYGLPFESGPREWISDVNVCYKREMMDVTRDIWHERFNEALIHWALKERGETLYLSSDLVVMYRTPYTSLRGVLPERFHWGRLFGHVRASSVGPLRRVLFAFAGPLMPLVLLVRHGQTQSRLGNFGRFLRAAPTMLVLLIGWTAGETWGIITNRP